MLLLAAVNLLPFVALGLAMWHARRCGARWRWLAAMPLLALPLGFAAWYGLAFLPTRTGFELLILPAYLGGTWLAVHEVVQVLMLPPQHFLTWRGLLAKLHWGATFGFALLLGGLQAAHLS